MTEAQIQKEIVAFLRMLGCAVYVLSQGYRRDPGGTRMTPGLPDLYIVHPQAWTWAEVKTPRGRLTLAQEGFRDACLGAGLPWQLWRSVDDSWAWAVEVGLIEEAT